MKKILIIACIMIMAATSCSHHHHEIYGKTHEPNDSIMKYYAVEQEINGHSYLFMRTKNHASKTIGVVHNPDCKCHQVHND